MKLTTQCAISSIIVLSSIVTGCATDGLAPDQRLANRADSQCASYGIYRGSDQYLSCLQLVEQQRQANILAWNQMLQSGLQMMRPHPQQVGTLGNPLYVRPSQF